MAEVVPLRRPGAPAPAESDIEVFLDVADPDRALSVTWVDERQLRLTIDAAGDDRVVFSLDADDALELVRAVVAGLPVPGDFPGTPATVLAFPTDGGRT